MVKQIILYCSGHAEAQLTEKGYQQAELVAEKLPNKEFKSTVYWRRLLKRRETARKIAERNQLTIETEPRLIEMNFGIYDGEPIETTAFQENRSRFCHFQGIGPRCCGSNLSD